MRKIRPRLAPLTIKAREDNKISYPSYDELIIDGTVYRMWDVDASDIQHDPRKEWMSQYAVTSTLF